MMEFKQDITIKEDIDLSPLSLYIAIKHLQWQMGRFLSDEKSEDGTISRTKKDCMDATDKVENEFKKLFYEPQNGLMFKVDRLSVKSDRQDKLMIGISIGVAVSIIVAVLTWFFRK